MIFLISFPLAYFKNTVIHMSCCDMKQMKTQSYLLYLLILNKVQLVMAIKYYKYDWTKGPSE